MTQAFLGLDIGGTSITADLVSPDGVLLAADRRWTGRGPDAIVAVQGLLTTMAQRATDRGLTLSGVGVLTPGLVDSKRGIVRIASNLDWEEVALGEVVASHPAVHGIPSAIGHDVRWAGIAEGTFGAARGRSDYAVLSIGTGIAACVVADSRVLVGAGGSAGEIGHASVVTDGDFCLCGRRGCLDAYAAGGAMLRRYRARVGRAEGVAADVAGLVQAAASGTDPVAAEVWDEAITALARGLSTLTMTTDPEVIVLVGGIANAGDLLTVPLRKRLAEELVWKAAPDVVTSPLRALPGRAGAVLCAMSVAGRRQDAERWSADDVLAWAGHLPEV